MTRITPLRQQYLDIKAEYPDCILFFRLGDFYETFDDDAEVAARVLDLTLTSRPVSPGKDDTRIPMAGVPHHALENYIARLIEHGYHVAVCDQVGEAPARGIIERRVSRVITPGTVVEDALLAKDRPNYLLALWPDGNADSGDWRAAGLAWVDISTGEFAATALIGEHCALQVLEELARLTPREVLLPESWAQRDVSLPGDIHLSPLPDWRFEFSGAEQALCSQFAVTTLAGYGLQDKPQAVCAAGAILHYLRKTRRESLARLTGIRVYDTASFMVLDTFTRRNLELVASLQDGNRNGSLLQVLDRTMTAMGARRLRQWINQPLLQPERILARLDAVETLTGDAALREDLQGTLRQVADLERLASRLPGGRAGPRDLLALRSSLLAVPRLVALIASLPALKPLAERLDACEEAAVEISHAVSEDAPATLNAIGVILPGYSDELDSVLQATRAAREWIAGLEQVERERTGIPRLRVGYNKVFGYYIEISRAWEASVPPQYIRKQTLVNAERYITPELKEYEAKVLSAEEQIQALERRLFEKLCEQLATFTPRLTGTARAIAHLDAFLSLAEVAVREGYCRPQIREDGQLHIVAGRHPVVERNLERGLRFTPNDCSFDDEGRIHIITGPNMSGKSTCIRQVALITLMAQIGSFVPADEAGIGLVDRIFARIGAQDEIHAGHSTFMVEMVETARILAGSSERSLIILDEVGRGTSTWDGLAIARAVIEYIHNSPQLNCRTLFATHYHELTALPQILPRTRNYNVAVVERGEDIVFLHQVVPGGADRSYGVYVARIAGLPRPVVQRADELLRQLETGEPAISPNGQQEAETPAPPAVQPEMPGALQQALLNLSVDELSPLEALTKLYDLKHLAEEECGEAAL
ncbi:MAG: DNA mismatch repair protein MutS [Anaerolineaceae bacterium]|nr:DNA mismatch repair protein MutS [Anaerolineaceae bacterium]